MAPPPASPRNPPRFAIVAIVFAALLVVAAGVLLALAVRETPRGGAAGTALASAIGGPFRLIDQNGKAVSDADLKGKWQLVFFGFTHCPDVCPTTLFDISEIMRALGPDAERTRAAFITVDPERDTQEVLKDYMSSFDPHVTGLTGDLPAITSVAKEYRAYFKKVNLDGGGYTMDHTAITYLMDKEGRFVSPFNLRRTPQASAADLRSHL
jgi:protein SCO1